MSWIVGLSNFERLGTDGQYRMKPKVSLEFTNEEELKEELKKAGQILGSFCRQCGEDVVLYLTADRFYDVLDYKGYNSYSGRYGMYSVSVDTSSDVNYLEIS